MRRFPLGNGRGSCCWARGGPPSFQGMAPVRRSTMATVEMLRKLTTRLPSGHSATVLPCVHSSRWSWSVTRSEEHTSELQSLRHVVCRLLLEKKKKKTQKKHNIYKRKQHMNTQIVHMNTHEHTMR